MLKIIIPGWRDLNLEHLVLDYNGTLAVDGELIPAVPDLLAQLADKLQLHVLTADTFGFAEMQLKSVNSRVIVLTNGRQDVFKKEYVAKLGSVKVACIGNGLNDRLMIKKAALGIVVMQEEGAYTATMAEADVVCRSIVDALRLLINPRRLIATLRNG
ncbi:ATPase P [bacterium]|nr:ATPase P [bacterium]